MNATHTDTWRERHYPSCVRCGLRVYRSNFTGRLCSEVTGQSACPAWNLPDTERPTYPWSGSTHEVVETEREYVDTNSSPYSRAMAAGHRARKGHDLHAYYQPSGENGLSRYVYECCQVTS